MKLLIVGNIAGGKTVLARKLAALYDLPLTHVDSIQFLPGLKIRPHQETQTFIDHLVEQDRWIIDGFGPLNKIEERFEQAEHIIFVDLPLTLHGWWLLKRQIQSLWSPRSELPKNCSELSWSHTVKLFRTLWRIHKKMRPQLLRIFSEPNLKYKIVYITSKQNLDYVAAHGLPCRK